MELEQCPVLYEDKSQDIGVHVNTLTVSDKLTPPVYVNSIIDFEF